MRLQSFSKRPQRILCSWSQHQWGYCKNDPRTHTFPTINVKNDNSSFPGQVQWPHPGQVGSDCWELELTVVSTDHKGRSLECYAERSVLFVKHSVNWLENSYNGGCVPSGMNHIVFRPSRQKLSSLKVWGCHYNYKRFCRSFC